MPRPISRAWRLSAAALAALFCVTFSSRGEPCDGLTLDRLERLSPGRLAELFTKAEVGRPLAGCARGRLLYLTDRRLPKLKVKLANVVWRGKGATEDGCFVNRWVGGLETIDSRYVLGPSWVDGRPAIIMEYPPGTALFENMHDELREVAPGLYLGPVFERFPCPKLRGYVALQIDPCEKCRFGRP